MIGAIVVIDTEFLKRGFNCPAHRNLRVSEGVENLLR